MKKENIESAVKSNLEWFRKSGVMDPSDGSWGVAERIVQTNNNATLTKTLRNFPYYLEFENYAILEQRRPDCNFQTALLFLMAGDYFTNSEFRKTGENILSFLFNRSGLLNKTNHRYAADTWPIGCWGWTHGSFYNTLFFFDDNAWNLTIQLIMAEMYPHLEKKYQLASWSEKLAEQMADAFEDQFLKEPSSEHPWSGELDSPHWGSLVCMGLSLAYKNFKKPRYLKIIKIYHDYILEKADTFSTSEFAYIIIGASFSATFVDESYAKIAEKFADKLLEESDANGIIPSQWNEAPEGELLVDLIYTMNWSLMAFQLMASLSGEKQYQNLYQKQLDIIVEIQDTTSESHLKGCWRGMYDFEEKQWGGGDCFEGGSGSIYTGWTNAPISLVLLGELIDKSLMTL